MEHIDSIIEIAARIDTVWDVLTDPSYITKLYPDAVHAEVDPPGRSVVGQKYHVIGKAGRRRLEIYAELVQLEAKKRLVTRNTPGGLFKSFQQMIVLGNVGALTPVKISFDYELSLGYVGKVLNAVLIARLVKDNLESYGRNLKEICELLPLPQ